MPMQNEDRHGDKDISIATFADTFGAAHQNGVARFISDMLQQARIQRKTLNVYTASKHLQEESGLHNIPALISSMPNYPALEIAWPLKQQRESVYKDMEDANPDIIHVSTPGPIGWLGRSIAEHMEKPLIGIYHTNFPAYAREVTRHHITAALKNPLAWAPSLMSILQENTQKLIERNPDFWDDAVTVASLLHKNWTLLRAEGNDTPEYLAHHVEKTTYILMKIFYKPFTIVITRSQTHRKDLTEKLGIPETRIRDLPPGIDTEQFHPRHKNPAIWKQFGIPDNAIKILHVGRVSMEKNMDLLVEIWQRIQAQRRMTDPHIALVMVGTGEMEQEFITKTGGKHVYMLGAQYGETLSALYASADVFVFPSTTETLGQVGMEASASGLPVLVTDRGGPQSYVRDGKTGYVLAGNEPDMWADTLLRLAREPQLRQRMGNNAHQYMEQRNIGKTFAQYWEIHREATALSQQKTYAQPTVHRNLPAIKTRRPYTRGSLLLSDYHGGKQQPEHKTYKHRALEKMLEYAKENTLAVVYGGDMGDRRSHVRDARTDMEILHRWSKHMTETPVYIYGNHDHDFSAHELQDLMGNVHIAPGLVHTDSRSGIACTHGHVLELTGIEQVLQESTTPQDVLHKLQPQYLEADLQWFRIKYDIAELAVEALHRWHLHGIEDAWEALLYSTRKTRAACADALAVLSPNTIVQRIADIIDFHNNHQIAAKLGSLLHAWAIAAGHTHAPGIWRAHDRSGTRLIGNCGSFVSREDSPTCIVAAYPDMYLLEYDEDSDMLTMRQHESLTRAEMEEHEASLNRSTILTAVP